MVMAGLTKLYEVAIVVCATIGPGYDVVQSQCANGPLLATTLTGAANPLDETLFSLDICFHPSVICTRSVINP